MLKRFRNLLQRNSQIVRESVYKKIDNLFDSLSEDIIKIEIGSDLYSFTSGIVETIGAIRCEIKEECGFIMPAVNIKDNCCIQENEFVILIRGKKVFDGFVIPREEETREEIYEALKTVIYDNLEKIFTNELTEKYIDKVQKKNGRLIWDISSVLSVVDINTILSDLILKGKSINNIDYIFEKIGENILSNGECRNYLNKINPHTIAKQIAKNI